MASNHLDLELNVDFNTTTITGSVTHNMTILAENVESIFFDSTSLNISKVLFVTDDISTEMNYTLTTPNNKLGDALEVKLAETLPVGRQIQVKIDFQNNTEPGNAAISWLTPNQTAGKVLPYIYSQCEDVACRSIAPMQDTPAIKITYTSKVTVLNQYVVKMSANETSMTSNDTHSVYLFNCSIPIPSYLIAIAVGDLQTSHIGDDVYVVTEPAKMAAVVAELQPLPKLFGDLKGYLNKNPYSWGNYTILILPPSFPMGGMENPLLTFASPTIITGDGSQVDVCVHEMAHSWTGNTVTCENWSNLWLNEGFTVFLERKVQEINGGHDIIAKKDNLLNAAFIGNRSMYTDMMGYGYWNSYSSLYP